MSHDHYRKSVSHLKAIDVYRVLDLFGVDNHAVGHAIKKLLLPGGRGAKGREQDLREAIDSINRALQMMEEDAIGLNGLCDRLKACETRQNTQTHTETRVEQINALQALKSKEQI